MYKIFLIICVLVTGTSAATNDYTKYVNPFIGTGGHGHTFPGATVPFGFVQLSPDTRVDNWDGSGGYHYSDSIIYGFSHTHLSGTGIPDYCDILFSPYVSDEDFLDAKPEDTKNGYASKFSHENENAEAGYYSVLLEDENIFAEMTATKRVGLHRYTFPEKTDNARISLDLNWRDEVLDSSLKIVDDKRIEGYRRSKSWAKDQIVYFVAEFSKPFSSYRIRDYDNQVAIKQGGTLTSKNIKTNLNFKVSKNEQILLKVAISPVSIEGARKNLEAELNHWDFEKVRISAKNDWNKELSKIEISGGTNAQLTNFYTALYHTMIAPNIFQDVDGKYLGLDKKIHNISEGVSSLSVGSPRVNKGINRVDQNALPYGRATDTRATDTRAADTRATDTNYTIFSLWDTFRATHPLYTIIDEKRTVDFINTFIRQYEQGGKLPVWELAANETDTMIGYHSVSVIADAMAKGIKGFDYEKAFEASKNSAELDIEGLDSYRRRGYISMEDEQESVSRTLEYAYNDYCLAVMAKILADKGMKDTKLDSRSVSSSTFAEFRYYNKVLKPTRDYEKHLKRSQFYKNLFDQETGFMRPKQNGNWISPFIPNDVTFHFTEANAWQYTFFVPHDVSGLISLYGGKKDFANKLDALFTADSSLAGRNQVDITGLIGQYAHGNEPSHHIAYLYNYADQPWKTQSYVRKIMDEFYTPTPDGLIGNEDCGQMSAWYILSAMGFYQVNPSVPLYAIGSPIFREAKINLENGKTFTIKTNVKNGSARHTPDSRRDDGVTMKFIKSVKLNGKPHRKSFFTHTDIQNGGTLEFEMSPTPVKDWFTEAPVSKVEIDFPSVPTVKAKRVFEDKTDVVISTPEKDVKIFYTLDNSVPDEKSTQYQKPLSIDKTTIVKAIAIKSDGKQSLVAESILNKMPNDWDVELFSTYNRQYTGGGVKGLVDGLRGTLNFASGEWQGYQDQDFIAVIDLKRETEIKTLGGSFLQDARPWIWMPTRIEFEVSNDGKDFTKVVDIITDVAERDMTPQIKNYTKEITPTKARYVRVKATNLGKIPEWHPGAGFQAFIFVDEIFIK